jgi:hypothetical protein
MAFIHKVICSKPLIREIGKLGEITRPNLLNGKGKLIFECALKAQALLGDFFASFLCQDKNEKTSIKRLSFKIALPSNKPKAYN